MGNILAALGGAAGVGEAGALGAEALGAGEAGALGAGALGAGEAGVSGAGALGAGAGMAGLRGIAGAKLIDTGLKLAGLGDAQVKSDAFLKALNNKDYWTLYKTLPEAFIPDNQINLSNRIRMINEPRLIVRKLRGF